MLESSVILCGGKSSRMHTNKVLLPFGDVSLVAYQYLKLSAIFKNVAISCKTSQKNAIYDALCKDFESLDLMKKKPDSIKTTLDSTNIKSPDEVPFLLEDESTWTPISGILSALDWISGNKRVFILSCDCPFVSNKTIQILISNSYHYDVTYARDSEYLHPLVAVWSDNTREVLEQSLHNNAKITSLLSSFSVKSIYFNKEEFFNINTRSDYKKALKILGR